MLDIHQFLGDGDSNIKKEPIMPRTQRLIIDDQIIQI